MRNKFEVGTIVTHLSNDKLKIVVSKIIKGGSHAVCEWILDDGKNVTAIFHVNELKKWENGS